MARLKIIRKILKAAGMLYCFLFLLAALAWAGDCSGPGDCGGNKLPDNFTRTVGVGGVITGIALALRGTDDSNDEDKEPEKKDDEGDAIDIGGGEKKAADDAAKKEEKKDDEGDAIDIGGSGSKKITDQPLGEDAPGNGSGNDGSGNDGQ